MGVNYLIAGAGSPGPALAARLAENPAAEVLLLEGGPDYPSRQETPAELRDARSVAGTHDWDYLASPVSGRSGPYPRGKVVGGTSCMQIAARYLDAESADRGEVFLFLASGLDVSGMPEALWVVDASVMPAVPAVPPHLTTIMIAERAARWLADVGR